MGNNSGCCCSCLEPGVFWMKTPQPLVHGFEIHANPSDLLTLHDGLCSIFVKGAHDEVVFDKSVLLVISGERQSCCYSAWIPEEPMPFEDFQANVTMVCAVLRDGSVDKDRSCCAEDECVIVANDSAKILIIDSSM